MNLLTKLTFAAISVSMVASAADTLDHYYQVRYASNLTQGDSIVNITNTGANGAPIYGPGFGTSAGNICVNVYAFSPDEQLISCCSCLVTPNGLVNVTANRDLVSNTLTGIRPNSIVIKLVATSTAIVTGSNAVAAYAGSNCSSSAALAGNTQFPVAPQGLLAWGTTLHSATATEPPPVGTVFSITETPFLPATLSGVTFSGNPSVGTINTPLGDNELSSITERCKNIIGNGSTFGICRSCRLGGLGGSKL